MFCTQCGTALPDDASFCSKCGRALRTHDEKAAEATRAPAENAGGARSWAEADRAPFRFGGRWWTRGPLGEVLLFDDGSRDWRIALATETPFFMRRPKFSSLRTPAVWLYVLFGLFILATLIALVADADRAFLLWDIADGKLVTFSQEQASYEFMTTTKGFQYLAVLLIVPFFLWWTRRATCNARSLGATDPEFGPGWAIGWWFIPFANWVQPSRVLLQAWRVADPTVPPDEGSWYRSKSPSVLIILWWIAFLIGNTAWSAIANVAVDEEVAMTASELAGVVWIVFALDIAMIGIAALAITVVARLTSRHERANEKFDLQGGLDSVPNAGVSRPAPYDMSGATATGW